MQKGRFSPSGAAAARAAEHSHHSSSGDAVVQGTWVVPGVAQMAQEVTLCPQPEQRLCQLVSRGR